MPADPVREPFLLVLAGTVGVLAFASLVSRLLQARAGGGARAAELANLEARIRSWWVMVGLLAGAVLLGRGAVITLFALVSAAALRELSAQAPAAVRDRGLDAACYALTAVQYLLVAYGDPRLLTVALPLAAPILLPIAALASGGVAALQARIAYRLWWTAIAGWCLSFVPALALPGVAGAGGLLFFVWIVVVAQGSDVLQYVFGKLYGRRPIAPAISPDKTVEGFAGGVVCATAIGTALGWMTPFGTALAGFAALVVALLGFAGGLLLSGVKRDLGIKDWGTTIRGHGGVLDRVDSLVLSAPVLCFLALAAGSRQTF